MIPSGLAILVIAAAIFAVGGLIATKRVSAKFAPRRNFAPGNGSEGKGIRYALLAGMMPWAKESARNHLPTYFAGILYHLGIAAGFFVLASTLISPELSGFLRFAVMVIILLAAAAGTGLFFKRTVTPTLRAISTPDDFLANILVTIFLLVAAATLWKSEIAPTFLISASILLLYIPLGKIRHCAFFFYSRITFGRFFGRRNVLPHQAPDVKEFHVGR